MIAMAFAAVGYWIGLGDDVPVVVSVSPTLLRRGCGKTAWTGGR